MKRKKLMELMPRLRFIDIEASDGGPDAWPIELGVAQILRSGGETHAMFSSTLINPDPSWPEEKWSSYAQRVHGITREELKEAPAAQWVALRALAVLAEPALVLVSDSPRNDQPWLDRLLDLAPAGRPEVKIISPWAALNGLVDPDKIHGMKEWLKANKGPHRAGPDAARLANCLIEGVFSAQPPSAAADQEGSGPSPG